MIEVEEKILKMAIGVFAKKLKKENKIGLLIRIETYEIPLRLEKYNSSIRDV